MDDYHAFTSTRDGKGAPFPWKLIIVLAVVYEILCMAASCQ